MPFFLWLFLFTLASSLTLAMSFPIIVCHLDCKSRHYFWVRRVLLSSLVGFVGEVSVEHCTFLAAFMGGCFVEISGYFLNLDVSCCVDFVDIGIARINIHNLR